MIEDLSRSAVKSIKKLEGSLTTAIKRDALKAGWPKDLVASLRVKITDDSMSVVYSDAESAAIEDLEFGTQGSSPRPVFRKFADKHYSEISEALELAIADRLAELENA